MDKQTGMDVSSASEEVRIRDRGAECTPSMVAALTMANVSASTLGAYRYSLERYGRWCGQSAEAAAADLLSLTATAAKKRLLDYRASFSGRMSPATVNGRLAGIRALIRAAHASGLIPWIIDVPWEKTQLYRDTSGVGRDAVSTVFAELGAGTDPIHRRDYAMAHLLYTLALHRKSIVALDFADYEPIDQCIWVLPWRSSQRRRKDLSKQTSIALLQWIAVRGHDPGPLFVQIRKGGRMTAERLSGDGLYRVIHSWGTRFGVVKSLQARGFRNTAITEATRIANQTGIPLSDVRAFSDHATLGPLSYYADSDDFTQKQLQKLISGEC